MGIISWIILGALAGWIASLTIETAEPNGVTVSILIGIAGALIGGWVAPALGVTGSSGSNPQSVMIAILGAVLLLTVVKASRLRA